MVKGKKHTGTRYKKDPNCSLSGDKWNGSSWSRKRLTKKPQKSCK